MKRLGIDIGTTTISGVVIEVESGEVLHHKTIKNDSFLKTGIAWQKQQDVTAMISKAVAVVDELLSYGDEITGIGITGQMHGILYVDADGTCVSPLYTWQDGSGEQAEFDGNSLVQNLQRSTAGTVATGYGLVTHLYHLKKNLVPQSATGLCTIGDYLGMCLTARKQPWMHTSNAASIGFFDCGTAQFQTKQLQQLGMDLGFLPETTDAVACLGKYGQIPVTIAIGDNQASFLGAVGLDESIALLNMGTGGQISVLSRRCDEIPQLEVRPLLCGYYLLVGSSLCGGRAYAVLERFFRDFSARSGGTAQPQYALMEQLAYQAQRCSDPLQVTTTFQGTRQQPDQRGEIAHITEDNFTPGGLILGVLNGMVEELWVPYYMMLKHGGVQPKTLKMSGNGLRQNTLLQQLFEKRFGLTAILADGTEEAACGAAISGVLETK